MEMLKYRDELQDFDFNKFQNQDFGKDQEEQKDTVVEEEEPEENQE